MLASFFAAPKGTDTIQMVYGVTKSRLNDTIWIPTFSSPMVNTLLRAVDFDTMITDSYIGEMFLNFMKFMRHRLD